MALAYLEIGKISASSNSKLKDTHEFENAIAYQLYHAVELFYKYMLLGKGVTKMVHDIAELENEYEKHFSDEKYKLDHPFDFSSYKASSLNPEEEELAKAHLQQFKPKFMDQHLRYPSSHNTGGYSYKLEPSYFNDIEKQMLSIVAVDC